MPTRSPTTPPRRTILVVDDEVGVLHAVRRSLRGADWLVLTADSGSAALATLAAEPVEVVIADYRMPQMDGVELLERVKREWPEVQRVMLTGAADVQLFETIVNRVEVFRFLNKPWSDVQLRLTLNQCFETIDLRRLNRQMEQALTDSNRQLQAANQDLERQVQERTRALLHAEKMAALGRMAGGVAHEINNPLGGILAFVQLLKREAPPNEAAREAQDAILACTLRCKTIVDSLLRFSRRPVLENRRPVDLNEVAQVGLTVARLDNQAPLVAVELELQPGLPLILGQASLLEQVVVNLLQNAFHASESDGRVQLRTLTVGAQVWLQVEDKGCGIPPEHLPHIFEPFYTTKEVGQGTGLGLSLSYWIAIEHSGDLRVQSQPGEGALFTLSLPVSQEESEP